MSHAVSHYFAYGSNMNIARVRQRGLAIDEPVAARLNNYCLRFNKASIDQSGVGHANIEYQFGSVVEGVVYPLLKNTEILKMDPFEKAPWNYGRDAVRVETSIGLLWAWAYFANSALLQDGLEPSAQYLEHLLAGKGLLSPAYYATLLRWRKD